MKKQLHSDIQKAVKDWLQWHGYFVYWNKAGLGTYKGVSDLVAIKGGRASWIEIKTGEKDGLNHNQEIFKEEIRKHGGEYHRIWTIDQLEQMEIRRML